MKDWYIVDSTTIKVRDALLEEFPGTGDYAALKGHKVLSVGGGAPVRYHFSPAREHDSPPLQIDESWRGLRTTGRPRLRESRAPQGVRDR